MKLLLLLSKRNNTLQDILLEENNQLKYDNSNSASSYNIIVHYFTITAWHSVFYFWCWRLELSPHSSWARVRVRVRFLHVLSKFMWVFSGFMLLVWSWFGLWFHVVGHSQKHTSRWTGIRYISSMWMSVLDWWIDSGSSVFQLEEHFYSGLDNVMNYILSFFWLNITVFICLACQPSGYVIHYHQQLVNWWSLHNNFKLTFDSGANRDSASWSAASPPV